MNYLAEIFFSEGKLRQRHYRLVFALSRYDAQRVVSEYCATMYSGKPVDSWNFVIHETIGASE